MEHKMEEKQTNKKHLIKNITDLLKGKFRLMKASVLFCITSKDIVNNSYFKINLVHK